MKNQIKNTRGLLSISLFSGAGIGDLGLRAGGCKILAMCELEDKRLGLARANFPEAVHYQGDIWEIKGKIVSETKKILNKNNRQLDVISCTAPCQGMSKNGQGTLLRNIREGKRPKLDPRNRLILPALEIIKELRPRVCIFENVMEMRRTIIEDNSGRFRTILEVIKDELGEDYVGKAYDVEFADYGIPQRRQRLITIFSRDEKIIKWFNCGGDLIPDTTHSMDGRGGKMRWVSVMDAISDFPPLDAKEPSLCEDLTIPFHRVPVLDEMKYFWVSNTPPGKSAFDNQCVKCGYDQNLTHTAKRDKSGINRASKDTPLYCVKCGEMLPRPSTKNKDGTRRIMSGYTSAYKRMAADLPAPALTRNFSYACSDQKLHPYQNRVLSLAEAMRIHTISDYEYVWEVVDSKGKTRKANDSLIRLVIGESIPPRFMQLLIEHLVAIANGEKVIEDQKHPAQAELFAAL